MNVNGCEIFSEGDFVNDFLKTNFDGIFIDYYDKFGQFRLTIVVFLFRNRQLNNELYIGAVKLNFFTNERR